MLADLFENDGTFTFERLNSHRSGRRSPEASQQERPNTENEHSREHAEHDGVDPHGKIGDRTDTGSSKRPTGEHQQKEISCQCFRAGEHKCPDKPKKCSHNTI